MIDEKIEEMRYHAALAYAYERAAKELLESFDEIQPHDRRAHLRAAEYLESKHKEHDSLVEWNDLSRLDCDDDAR